MKFLFPILKYRIKKRENIEIIWMISDEISISDFEISN